MSVLSLSSVTVRRGSRTVLDDVSLQLRCGEILVVVGPNGAGKTTLLESACGAVALTRGTITLDGVPLRSFEQRARAFAHVSAEGEPAAEDRVLRLVQAAAKHADPAWAEHVRARLGLDAQSMRRTVGTLSRGERRRLLLYEALTSSKPFLLMDEPTGVFDPLQLTEIAGLMRAAAERGAALLLSVHQMSDAEAIASRVLILHAGRVLTVGTLAELRDRARLHERASLQELFLAFLRGAAAEATRARA